MNVFPFHWPETIEEHQRREVETVAVDSHRGEEVKFEKMISNVADNVDFLIAKVNLFLFIDCYSDEEGLDASLFYTFAGLFLILISMFNAETE